MNNVISPVVIKNENGSGNEHDIGVSPQKEVSSIRRILPQVHL